MCPQRRNLSVCDFSSKVEMGKWIEDLNLAIDMAKKSQEKSSIFLDAGLSDRSNRKFSFKLDTYTALSVNVCFCGYFEFFLNLVSRKSRLDTNTPNVLLIPPPPLLYTTSCPPSSPLRVVRRGFSGAGVWGWHELLPHFTGQADAPPCQHNHACVLASQHQCVYVWPQPGCGGTPPLPQITCKHCHLHTPACTRHTPTARTSNLPSSYQHQWSERKWLCILFSSEPFNAFLNAHFFHLFPF